jgi:hypothetical protein
MEAVVSLIAVAFLVMSLEVFLAFSPDGEAVKVEFALWLFLAFALLALADSDVLLFVAGIEIALAIVARGEVE